MLINVSSQQVSDFFESLWGSWAIHQESIDRETTLRQVDFIESTLALPRSALILDLGCGHGRHLINLSDRGYSMVGLDQSPRALAFARDAAWHREVGAGLVMGDMRRLPFGPCFDAVIVMFTSLGYFQRDEEDLQVMREMRRVLKEGGKALVDLMPRDYIARNFQAYQETENRWGQRLLERREFDAQAGRVINDYTLVEPDGREVKRRFSTRVYTFTELAGIMETAGLRLREAYGDYDASSYDFTSPRLILVGEKQGS